jgi:hypothetical protein
LSQTGFWAEQQRVAKLKDKKPVLKRLSESIPWKAFWLFEMPEAHLRSQCLEARGGQIIVATLVPVPKQRMSREENKEIKAGRLLEGWDEN